MILLALDFGGTKHTVGVMQLNGSGWLQQEQVFSPAQPDARYDLDSMLAMARRLLGSSRPKAIGVSFGGPVDARLGVVHLSHHVTGWENTPLKEILERELGAPASVDNDANVAALGEKRFGAGQGYHSLLYITVSTGVGGGWILNGHIWQGADGMAGEIGHITVDPNGPLCLCGKRGCVERLASGPYLARDARERMEGDETCSLRLREMCNGNLSAINGKLISLAAQQGDPLATELIERSAWALGTGIGNAANLVNPQRFILGGGVTKSGDIWWEGVRRAARRTALPEVAFDIVPAALGDDAPLWGAAALALDLIEGES